LRLQEFGAQVMQSRQVPIAPDLSGNGERLRNLLQPFSIPPAHEIAFRQQAEPAREPEAGAQPTPGADTLRHLLDAFGNLTAPNLRPAEEHECDRTRLR
jgi:hypothetical protein